MSVNPLPGTTPPEEKPLPTEKDVSLLLKGISDEIDGLRCLRPEDTQTRSKIYQRLEPQVKKLQELSLVAGFSEQIFESSFGKYVPDLISNENTEISSEFIGLLSDMCEDLPTLELVIRAKCIDLAIKSCIPLDPIKIQPDAQFLFNTLNLIATAIDGSTDASSLVESLLSDTPIIQILKFQLQRDDFDDNVLASTETLSIFLQMLPEFIPKAGAEILNLLLRLCANLRSSKSPSENEAAHNAFNAITFFCLDEEGIRLFSEQKGVDILLSCWGGSSTVTSIALASIQAALSSSVDCCVQFVESGGIKKLFGFMKLENESPTVSQRIIEILESLLTLLPSDSIQLKRVVRKFSENSYEKVGRLISIAESFFRAISTDEDKDDSLYPFQVASCCIVALVGLAPNDIKGEIYSQIAGSQVIDCQSVIDAAEVQADKGTAGYARVRSGEEAIESLQHR